MGSRGGKNEPLQKSKSDYKYELLNQSWEFGGGSFLRPILIFIRPGFAVIKSFKFYSHFKYGCHSSSKGNTSFLVFILHLCDIETFFFHVKRMLISIVYRKRQTCLIHKLLIVVVAVVHGIIKTERKKLVQFTPVHTCNPKATAYREYRFSWLLPNLIHSHYSS